MTESSLRVWLPLPERTHPKNNRSIYVGRSCFCDFSFCAISPRVQTNGSYNVLNSPSRLRTLLQASTLLMVLGHGIEKKKKKSSYYNVLPYLQRNRSTSCGTQLSAVSFQINPQTSRYLEVVRLQQIRQLPREIRRNLQFVPFA